MTEDECPAAEILCFEPPPTEILEKIKEQAKNDGTPILKEDAGRFLQWLTQISRPRRILELGTGLSYSTHRMLAGFEEAQILTLEHNTERRELAKKFLSESDSLNRVKLIGQSALDYLKEHPEEKYDMIFIDSMKREYPKFPEICVPQLNFGGFLIADNVLFRGLVGKPPEEIEKKHQNIVKNLLLFNHIVYNHPLLATTILNIGDGILCARKQSLH